METIAPTQSALEELRQKIQWVNWTYSQPDKKTGKRSKVPIEPHTGRAASPTDVDAWSGYNAAQTASRKHRDRGIGFVLHGSDPYAVIDLDKVIDLETGEIAPWAMDIVEEFDSYTELSPSGTGLHVWIRGELSGTGKNNKEAGIELYDRGRFITWTSEVFHDEAIKDRQYELNSIVDSLPEPVATHSDRVEEEHDKHGFFGNSIDDTQLLEMARRSSSGNLFKQLYDRGDWTGDKSASEADIKLAGMLAFWTGRDAERMESLLWNSVLVRDKWRENRTYISRTIQNAIRHCTKTYDPSYREASKESLRNHIERLEEWAVGTYHWPGRGGPSDRDVFRALLEVAKTYGKLRSNGIEVSASTRQLALDAAVGKDTVMKALGRLEHKHGFLGRVKSGGAREADTYRIELCNDVVVTGSSKSDHTINRDYPYGCHSTTILRVRNASPRLSTIGKDAAATIEYVHTRRGATLVEIAEQKQRNTKQGRDNLKRRTIKPLLDEGFLVAESGGIYTTPDDIQERLETFLEDSGHNREHRIQAERYRLAREAFHNPKNNTVPTIEELDTQIPETSHPNRVNRTSAPELVIPTGELILLADSFTVITETDLLKHPIDCDCIPCSMPAPNYAKPKMLPGDNPFHTKRRMF